MKQASDKMTGELHKLAALSDDQIDTSDTPEIKNFKQAEVGRFYRPVKKQVALRINADWLVWFKGQGEGYQT
ncbi:hypothetical protein MNBD_GAMMA26-1737 [hydrothermal vent metagenome]|uniref:Uncharacterized protein n=1 Tax=hydrothermal vent metagenome TaxID=652676 RepID=A0A3B1B9L1_9ZZZZ